jgi:hypothetical protein
MNTLRNKYEKILYELKQAHRKGFYTGSAEEIALEALITATLESLPKEKEKSPKAIEFTFGNKKPDYIEAHSDKHIGYNQALSDIKALLGGK